MVSPFSLPRSPAIIALVWGSFSDVVFSIICLSGIALFLKNRNCFRTSHAATLSVSEREQFGDDLTAIIGEINLGALLFRSFFVQ